MEKKLKEDLVEKETLLENAKKEKNDLQKLLSIETQKSIQLKKFAEEEQKKHIKYKNKLAKYKKSKTEEKNIDKEKPENKNSNFDYFIYSNSPLFDENKNIAKLKEDIFKLKKLLDEEINKNEVLRLLSENQKEKHDIVKNKYNKTKKLNMTLMNKIREKKFSLNKEIKMENEALKKQLIETENKNEELKLIIQKLNDEINSNKNNENRENKDNKDYIENNEYNEYNEHNTGINPINKIREDKYKSEKKNNLMFQKNHIPDKKSPRFSVQIPEPTFSIELSQKALEIINPVSNKDLIKQKFNKAKSNYPLSNIKNQKNMVTYNPSIKSPKKKTNPFHIKNSKTSINNLELNDSDINKEKEISDFELKLSNKIPKRREKRDNSEKVIRIFNGNNISSSEISSEKNLSENNMGAQIDNVIKENDNEDEDEKFNGNMGEIKKDNNINDNNNSIDNDK